MSKASRGSLAYSHITLMKMAWALFQGRFTGSSSRVALTCPLNGSGWSVKNLLEAQLNPFTDRGSDPLFEPQKDHHLGIEHVQVILFDSSVGPH